MRVDSEISDYPLESKTSEYERLKFQGRVLHFATRTILEKAGVHSGMHVLDLGSGAGDMAFVAAELVGPSGEVIGVDRSSDSVALANERAEYEGIRNVRFVVGDIHERTSDVPLYDAIIGRLVLMYASDPSSVLRTQAQALRSGGLVVPIEFDLFSAHTTPSTKLASQVLAWIGDAFSRGGV